MVLGVLVIVVVGLITVNYLRDRGLGKGLLPSVTTGNKAEQTPQTAKTHKVEKGESLWTIAENAYGSGYNWVDIARANKLSDPSEIAAGQELTLPDVQTKTLATKTDNSVKAADTKSDNTITTDTKVAAAETEAISGTSYTVVKGDNLWKIAVRAYGDGYKWSQVAKENKLAHPGLIHPGNVLTLPR